MAPTYGREVQHFLGSFSKLGRVAVFGGLLRDLAVDGSAARPHDIDLVVECANREDLARFLAPWQPHRNRYGGFRFKTAGWSFDVWCLQDTWAIKEGLVATADVGGLVRTTFFDWDAVLIDWQSSSLLTLPRYFNRLSSEVVEINLEQNPNPVGNLIRALRLMVAGRASLGRCLMLYAQDQLSRVPEHLILQAESLSYRTAYLSKQRLYSVRSQLEHAIAKGEPSAKGLYPKQLALMHVDRSAAMSI